MDERKVIRDAVHGDILFDPRIEIPLIDTPEIQRLRGIKQLGTASLVYPSAVHTRFDHSLGTTWVAGRILEQLARRGIDISEEEARTVRLSAIVHDVTHIPFGHTFEDERRLFDRHDSPDRTRQFLSGGHLGRVLDSLGETERVLALLNRDSSVRPFLHQIVSGTICADLLDYLARDAYFCGLSQRYDDRIFRYFNVVDDQLVIEAQKDGIVREDALSEIVNLLRLRYFLCERVYFHHSKTASGAMISKVVELCLARGLRLRDLYPLKDEGLFLYLRNRFGKDRPVQRLLDRIDARQIYKRAYVLTRSVGDDVQATLIARYHEDIPERQRAEAALAKRARLDPADVIVYCPSGGMNLKEAHVPVRIEAGSPLRLSDLRLPEVDELCSKHRNLWKFYVFVHTERPNALRDLSRAAESYFSLPNELKSLQSGQAYLPLADGNPAR